MSPAERTMDRRYKARNTCQTSPSDVSSGHSCLPGMDMTPCIVGDNYRSWRSRDGQYISHEFSGTNIYPYIHPATTVNGCQRQMNTESQASGPHSTMSKLEIMVSEQLNYLLNSIYLIQPMSRNASVNVVRIRTSAKQLEADRVDRREVICLVVNN